MRCLENHPKSDFDGAQVLGRAETKQAREGCPLNTGTAGACGCWRPCAFGGMIISADQEEVVLEDFEDLLPPFLLPQQSNSSRMTSQTSSRAGSVSSCISSLKPDFLPVNGHKPADTATSATDDCSDCSSDVIIVEEECEVATTRAGRAKARHQPCRVLRTRSLNAVQSRLTSTNSRLSRKNRRSTLVPSKRPSKVNHHETVDSAVNQHAPTNRVRRSNSIDVKTSEVAEETLLDTDPKSHRNVPQSGSTRLPRVHDLIDCAALAGATLLASGKQSLLFDRITDPQRTNAVANGGASSRRKGSLTAPSLSPPGHKESLSRLFALAVANGDAATALNSRQYYAAGIMAKHNLRHPFLYPWEKDEDRIAGGEWRSRRDCYQTVLAALEEAEKAETGRGGPPQPSSSSSSPCPSSTSDCENDPTIFRPRAEGKRPVPPRRDYSPPPLHSTGGSVKADLTKCLSSLEPWLLGYRWPTPSASVTGSGERLSPQKMTFWR
ncbi:hypothetical protein SprV_0200984500 [Sparganum proliferum]